MKNILVTTDFSDSATNAVNYAVELAQATGATITLFHAYSVPVMVSDAPVMPVISYEELENDNLELLKKVQSKIKRSAPGVNVLIASRIGFAHEEINRLILESHFDLVILGIKGHGNLSNLFGSTAISVAGNAKIPVLIVPAGARFQKLSSIAFAFDYREVNKPENIGIIQELARLFKAKVHILNIAGKEKEIPIEKALVAVQIDHLLEEADHDLTFPAGTDTVKGIETYVMANKCDMLAMIKRDRGFFDKLLKGSYTRKMAFHTHIPLLVLHD